MEMGFAVCYPGLRVVIAFWFIAAFTSDILAATYRGNPDDYIRLLRRLEPGDQLVLEAGTYDGGLRVHDLHGVPERPIVIEGPRGGNRAVLLGQPGKNIVSIKNASHIVIRNLEIDGRGAFVDGVKAEGYAKYAHHIVLEGLHIHGLAAHQQSVGISTKCPAWNWTLRSNLIEGVGTGMYLGNSDGSDPFIGGLIEGNQVLNTIGYNLQIKHQQSRPAMVGIPTESRQTIIRRNLFVKEKGGSEGPAARPNVLVGHLPLEGPGKDDEYIIYGNSFFQNPNEALFQGEGNIALYSNLFFNSHQNEFPAIAIQPHNDIPRMVRVFFNTVLDPWMGVRVLRKEENWVDEQEVIGNAVFSQTALQGGRHAGNIMAPYGEAHKYLNNPQPDLETMDLAPRLNQLKGARIDLEQFARFPEHDRDFEGLPRLGVTRGAYTKGGVGPSLPSMR